MASNVFLALGSNKGNKANYLKKAVRLLNENDNCKVVKISSVYLTSPYGSVPQDDFYNCVIEVVTTLSISELISFTKKIEKFLGRKNEERWGPREIDIDILFYNQLIYDSDELKIPHLEIMKRDFVLVPLMEISPGFNHPLLKRNINESDVAGTEKHILQKLNLQLL